MISLTLDEALYVLGLSPVAQDTHGLCALEPVPLKGGGYWMPEDVLDHPATQDVYDYLVDKVIPGGPTPEQTWDFGTLEAPNQAEIDAYNAASMSYTAPETERGSEDRVGEATALMLKMGLTAGQHAGNGRKTKRLR